MDLPVQAILLFTLHTSLCTVFLPFSLLRRAHDGFSPAEEFLGGVPQVAEIQYHGDQFAAGEGLVHICHIGIFIVERIPAFCGIFEEGLEAFVLALDFFQDGFGFIPFALAEFQECHGHGKEAAVFFVFEADLEADDLDVAA